MTVGDFYDLINQIAPFDTQMEFDNSGLLVGSASQEVNTVLFALEGAERIAAAYPLIALTAVTESSVRFFH